MNFWGPWRAGRAGNFAGGCVLLFAVGASSGASAQAFSSGAGFFPGTFAQTGQAADTRDFSVVPLVGLQESFTDNALLTPTNKQYDFITRPMLGADVNVQGGPATATVAGEVFYDAYAREGQLSGWSAAGQGVGSYSLVPNFLTIDGDGVLTNTNGSTFGDPAIDRVGTANRVQLATYDVGPRLTTTLDDFADLSVVGRFAQIFFGNPNASTIGLPTDSTILQGTASLDTAQRYAGYESVTNAQFEKDDHGFQTYGADQSFFVSVAPQIRIIGRGGYDDVTQPGIVNISAPLWSGGVEFTINQQSKITVEGGERFNHSAYAANLHLQLSDKLYAEGRYYETLVPDQLQINSAFTDFVTQTAQIPIQLASNTFTVNGNLDGEISLNKEADFHLVYIWEGQTVDFQAQWDDRLYLGGNGLVMNGIVANNLLTNEHDRTLVSGVTYRRNVAADLNFSAGASYYHTFANPFFGASELYNLTAGLQYDINPTMGLYGGYAYQRQLQLGVNGEGITENVLYAAITKRF